MFFRTYWLLSTLVFIAACTTPPAYHKITGNTMGTTYNITYQGEEGMQLSVDSILVIVNNSMSTYIESSLISQLNDAEAKVPVDVDRHFARVFEASTEINRFTSGAFNPSIMPVLAYWGFGGSQKTIDQIDSAIVDSLVKIVGMDRFALLDIEQRKAVVKTDKNSKLDFSAIAKGYGVDIVSELLESNGISNYMVEIGGEVRCRGVNPNDQNWTIAINRPSEDPEKAATYIDVFKMENKSVATSGNYRNFKLIDGKKIVHTINPKTGYPEVGDLLSATVFASDCMTADAYATAFMVLGKEASLAIASKIDGIDVYLVYLDEESNTKTVLTDGAESFIMSN